MAGIDDAPLRIGGVPRTAGAAAVDAAASAEAPEAIRGIDTLEIDAAARVAQSLAAGAIDTDTAVATLAEAAATTMLGPGADAAAIAAVRAEVEALLAGDPTLAALLRA